VDIISISLGIRDEPLSVVEALNRARRQGIIILASASNEGANNSIAFPARLEKCVCIGSADGKGSRSSFSPPFIGEEKYSALGEAVRGAWRVQKDGEIERGTYIRKSGTSTAVAISAGIVACLIDYTRQFTQRGKGADNWDNLRKIFIKMSEATAEEPYRYLAPKYLFGASKDMKGLIKSILRGPLGMCICVFNMYMN
jgi:subtilisin family serine protease